MHLGITTLAQWLRWLRLALPAAVLTRTRSASVSTRPQAAASIAPASHGSAPPRNSIPPPAAPGPWASWLQMNSAMTVGLKAQLEAQGCFDELSDELSDY